MLPHEPTADDVTRWALAAANGDDHAMAMFVRATQTHVWRLCAHLGNQWAADDLTQETYLRAFANLSSFAARSSAKTWLLSIARRVCADHVREQRRIPRLAFAQPQEQGAPDDFTSYAALRSLIDDLDPVRREAFVLTQVIGASYAEAADICSCPVGTIRSRVARARTDLVEAVRAARGGLESDHG